MHDRDTIWLAANGESIAIRDMTVHHLVNCLNYIDEHSKKVLIRDVLIEEVELRALLEFSKGKPYPFKQDDGKYIVINEDKEEADKAKRFVENYRKTYLNQ